MSDANIVPFRFDMQEVRVVCPPYIEASDLTSLIKLIPASFKENSDLCGCVYAFEVNDVLKIGFSRGVKSRLMGWMRTYRYAGIKVGRAAVTIPHLIENGFEKEVHNSFSERLRRIDGKEFFSARLEEFFAEISLYSIRTPSEPELQKIRSWRKEESEGRLETLKSAIFRRPGN